VDLVEERREIHRDAPVLARFDLSLEMPNYLMLALPAAKAEVGGGELGIKDVFKHQRHSLGQDPVHHHGKASITAWPIPSVAGTNDIFTAENANFCHDLVGPVTAGGPRHDRDPAAIPSIRSSTEPSFGSGGFGVPPPWSIVGVRSSTLLPGFIGPDP